LKCIGIYIVDPRWNTRKFHSHHKQKSNGSSEVTMLTFKYHKFIITCHSIDDHPHFWATGPYSSFLPYLVVNTRILWRNMIDIFVCSWFSLWSTKGAL
jgi:hypothetical protein